MEDFELNELINEIVPLQPISLDDFEQFSTSSGCGSDFSCPTTGC